VKSRFKTGWCVRCNAERAYRVIDAPEPSRPDARRWRKKRKKVCTVCGDDVSGSEPPKFGNVPTRSKHTGRTFQSKLEAGREPALIALQNVGAIADLRYQVPFRLELYATGAVDELMDFLESAGTLSARDSERTIARLIGNVRRSRRCVAKYVADFTYQQGGALVVEDPKGARTAVFRMKRELMVLAHNVEIVIPNTGGVQQRARGAGVAGRGTGSRLMGGR
jgi:hypothetical protein